MKNKNQKNELSLKKSTLKNLESNKVVGGKGSGSKTTVILVSTTICSVIIAKSWGTC